MRITTGFAALATAAALVAVMPAQAQTAHTVFFSLGSSRLDAEAMATIDRAAAEHARTGSTAVSIVGHTDTTGSASYNERLSQRRAEAVAQALSARGVPMSTITTAWRGETELAVQTGDNVPERRNRRAEIAVGGTPGTPAALLEAPSLSRITLAAGPFFGANLEDRHGSFQVGVNLMASYALTESIALSAEQAVYWNFDTKDEGVGGRTVAGVDVTVFDFDGLRPYIGANVGYTYIDGSSTGGFTFGPEVGVALGNWQAKVAYDFLESRDADEGVIAVTLGYGFSF